MPAMTKVFIALPTYNEAPNIAETISRINSAAKKLDAQKYGLDILVIDDNSPDGTAQIVKDLQKKQTNLHLLTGEKKGLGAAYIRGMTHILNNYTPDYIMEMDADLQHDPDEIPNFLQKAGEGYDFIIGSRYIKGGDSSEFGLKRQIYSWGANFIARFIAGIYKVSDCTSGFRCISAKFLKHINLQSLQSKGYAFQMDLLHAASKNGLKIAEIPITFPDRRHGSSKLGAKDVKEFFASAIRLRFKKYPRKINDPQHA